MTAEEYRACFKAFGLTPSKPSYQGATLYQDRDGEYHSIPDPEGLSEEEREAFLFLWKLRNGIGNN